uniref:Uncharacterized protein n=1 Tax=Magallana gigas TaxID=29159 RepID=K1QTF4_MAGGI
MIFWKSCDKVRKYQSFKSYDEYTYITERNFKYSGVDQELSQYSRPWQPESINTFGGDRLGWIKRGSSKVLGIFEEG